MPIEIIIASAASQKYHNPETAQGGSSEARMSIVNGHV
jgi:hypothetical protein